MSALRGHDRKNRDHIRPAQADEDPDGLAPLLFPGSPGCRLRIIRAENLTEGPGEPLRVMPHPVGRGHVGERQGSAK